MYYHVKVGSSASKGIGLKHKQKGTPKIGECFGPAPCGKGVADP